MRKRFGLHLAPRHLLDVIVAHRGSRSQGGFHVATFQQAALLSGMGPNSCQAIGLQFHHHRESIARLGTALLQLPDLALNPGYLLDVIPHLVREHGGLRGLDEVHTDDSAPPHPDSVELRKSTSFAWR